MRKLQTCKHFILQEIVPPDVFKRFGARAWMFFSPEALTMIDGLRTYFGRPVTVNTWHRGGNFSLRGFRPMNCSVGAEFSQHRLGRAFDCDIVGVSAQEARQEILTHQDDPLLLPIRCIEDKVNWLHIDCRNIDRRRILVVTP